MRYMSLDPFDVFQISYDYFIKDLKLAYYKQMKLAGNQDELMQVHLAYQILKSPILRLKFLCKHYKAVDLVDLKVVMRFKMFSLYNRNNIILQLNASLNKYIKLKKWTKINKIVQFLEYLDH